MTTHSIKRGARSQRVALNYQGSMARPSQAFSMSGPVQPIRIQSPVIKGDDVILPDLNYVLSMEDEGADETVREPKLINFPKRSSSYQNETFSITHKRILPPSIYLNSQERKCLNRPPIPKKKKDSPLAVAKQELKKIDSEGKDAAEAERQQFQVTLEETIARHKRELEELGGVEVEHTELLELKRYGSGTVTAVAVVRANEEEKDEDSSLKRRRQKMIERHKREIIELNEAFRKRTEMIKMEYDERMRPLQDQICTLMKGNGDQVEVFNYSGSMTPDSRYGVSPFALGMSLNRRPSDGAFTNVIRRAPLLRIVQK